MKQRIEFDEECPDCSGTGLYSGMGERDGGAVVCSTCDGSGKHHFIHEYESFEVRKTKPGIEWVIEVNPGIGVGKGNGYKLSDFGGQSYTDWVSGKPFPKGSEMRRFVCPAWWYQSANYKLKPNWKECGWGSFSECDNFKNKSKCWDRWDKENL